MKLSRLPFTVVLLGFLGLVGCEEESEAPEGMLAGECSDDADNDGNGLFDCDDPGCDGAPSCGGANNPTEGGEGEAGGEGEGEGGGEGEGEGGGEGDVACGPEFDPGGRACESDQSVCAVGCFCNDAGVLATFCNLGVCRTAADSCSRACEGFGGWGGDFGCDPGGG